MGWAPDLRDCGGLVSLGEQTLADPWGLLGSYKGSLSNVVVITQITGFPPLPGNL